MQSNDYIYTQFNIMASKVLLDLQALDVNNELPRVNLIGHSRGGLTNLQYALDHPDLVDSIFSLRTPYLGSSSASIDKHILGLFDASFSDCPGEDDIVNPNVYLGCLNRWNSQYDKLYSNIKAHALGGYQSLDMLVYQLIYPFIEKTLNIDIVQSRWYDENGWAVWDRDYQHNDSNNTHTFPHDHSWCWKWNEAKGRYTSDRSEESLNENYC